MQKKLQVANYTSATRAVGGIYQNWLTLSMASP